jgi:hypothetical protein
MTATIIFRNGQGGFVEAFEAIRLGYDYDGYNLYAGGIRRNPIEVVECTAGEVAESSIDGVSFFRTETGRVYKTIQ